MTYHTTIVMYAIQGYGVDDIVVLMRRRRKEFPAVISRDQIKYWVWKVHGEKHAGQHEHKAASRVERPR